MGLRFHRRALPAALLVYAWVAVFGLRRETEAARVPSAVFARIGADALATKKAPGFSFAVVRDGTIAYAGAFGRADVERNVPVTVETRFAIGSLTKQFTAASLLLLAERRHVALDDSLAKYLPAFPNGAAITLRMLLDQTSGLHNYPLLAEHPWPVSGPSTVQALVPFFAADKPDFAPGSRYEYSNTNYALLSAVIEKASGLDEAAFLQRNVFEPLKMTASGFGFAAQNLPGVAAPYSGRADFEPQPPLSLDLFSGAGAIVSAVPDLALWDIALMHGTLLDSTSMQALWTAGALANGEPIAYAIGFVPALLAGHREVSHNGLSRLQTGTVDMSQVDARFAQLLTPEFLASLKASLADRGAPTDWIYLGSQSVGGAVIDEYRMRLDGVEHVWSVGFTPDGKIAGSLLQ